MDKQRDLAGFHPATVDAVWIDAVLATIAADRRFMIDCRDRVPFRVSGAADSGPGLFPLFGSLAGTMARWNGGTREQSL